MSNAIYDVALSLVREGINMTFRLDGAIPFQHLKIVIDRTTLASVRSQFIFWNWVGLI